VSKTIPEQITVLRKASEPSSFARFRTGCLAATSAIVIGLLLAFYFLDHGTYLIAALMVGAMGFGLLQDFVSDSPHLTRARLALDHFVSVPATVRIVVEVNDGSNDYFAGVQDRAGNHWTFPFRPDGWSPRTGDFPAELRYIDGTAWPALILTETGILHTWGKPKQRALALPAVQSDGSTPPQGWIFLGVIMLLASLFWCAVIWGMYQRDSHIMLSGVVVEAEVLKVGHLRSERDESNGLVYRFNLPDGRVIESTWSEDKGRWREYRVGDPIRVHYHPDDPERHILEDPSVSSLSATLFVMAGGLPFPLLGGAFVVSGMRRLKRKA